MVIIPFNQESFAIRSFQETSGLDLPTHQETAIPTRLPESHLIQDYKQMAKPNRPMSMQLECRLSHLKPHKHMPGRTPLERAPASSNRDAQPPKGTKENRLNPEYLFERGCLHIDCES